MRATSYSLTGRCHMLAAGYWDREKGDYLHDLSSYLSPSLLLVFLELWCPLLQMHCCFLVVIIVVLFCCGLELQGKGNICQSWVSIKCRVMGGEFWQGMSSKEIRLFTCFSWKWQLVIWFLRWTINGQICMTYNCEPCPNVFLPLLTHYWDVLCLMEFGL